MRICIIGGGVVGLNIALEMSVHPSTSAGRTEIYLLEQEKFLGDHTSTRNSEVIHAGFVYPPDSLKAKLCVEGNALTIKQLDKLGVAYKRCGKWVIACGKDEDAALEKTIENAVKCGVKEFDRVNIEKFYNAEPSAYNVTSAVYSGTSGIMDAAAYIRALEVALSKNDNANVIYPCKVTSIDTVKKELSTERGPINYDILINSAGLWADDIHSMVCRGEDFQMCALYQIIPFKGEYYTWRKGKIRTMIYPAPDRFLSQASKDSDPTLVSSMGIHTHRNIAGELFVGPSQVKLTPDKKGDYSIETPPEVFAKELKKFIKDINAGDLEPAYAGNRPKLYKGGLPIGDFTIFKEGDIIHLLGMESPALTAAPALARYVAKMI
ncbi:MAG: hypothetical protein COV46_06405 [Deltaproteobacteria bacterium CG11_big_fil_rev_8_21_14_0_20_49_13]|nr:MAG: hypothetical protein COV46_06405 [Deltaproteobacteria bacterium CG11_big_fil_rev_8_21_14_0_20_49_13]